MRAKGFRLEVAATDGLARSARISTPHGEIETPTFMPVATFGAVRGISAEELAGAGAQILLSNTYHLHERPGEQTIEALVTIANDCTHQQVVDLIKKVVPEYVGDVDSLTLLAQANNNDNKVSS